MPYTPLHGTSVFVGSFGINNLNRGTSASALLGKTVSDTADIRVDPTEERLLDVTLRVTAAAVVGTAFLVNITVDAMCNAAFNRQKCSAESRGRELVSPPPHMRISRPSS